MGCECPVWKYEKCIKLMKSNQHTQSAAKTKLNWILNLQKC